MNLLRQFLTLGAIIGALPNNLADGQTADAVPLMADLNFMVAQVNANAAAASSISSLQSTVNAMGLRASFTPGLAFGGLTTGITYFEQIGYQFPIQNLLVVMGVVHVNSKGTAVGSATITGFPTSANIAWGSQASAGFPLLCELEKVTMPGGTTANWPVLLLPPNSGTAAVLGMVSGLNIAAYTNADFAGGAVVQFMGAYPIA